MVISSMQHLIMSCMLQQLHTCKTDRAPTVEPVRITARPSAPNAAAHEGDALTVLMADMRPWRTLTLTPAVRFSQRPAAPTSTAPLSAGRQRAWYVLPKPEQERLSARAPLARATCDQGRPYRDVVHTSNSYIMEEWMDFCEIYSVFLLHGGSHGPSACVCCLTWGVCR